MDHYERYLVREHTLAAKRYVWAVEELQRQVLNREDTTLFRRNVVEPARMECQASLTEWLGRHISSS